MTPDPLFPDFLKINVQCVEMPFMSLAVQCGKHLLVSNEPYMLPFDSRTTTLWTITPGQLPPKHNYPRATTPRTITPRDI